MNRNRSPIENLEERRLLAATVIKNTDVMILAANDGTKDNGNDVIVKFDGAVSGSTDVSKMRMFGYAYNTLTGGNDKKTINITAASVNGDGHLVLRTDVQIRKGAQLTLQPGAVSDLTNSSNLTIRTKKGLNRDRFTLALRAFKPNDKTYFGSDKLVGGATPVVANTAASEATVRAQLVSFLNKKKDREKTINQATYDLALAHYDSAANEAIVPAHNLRAAICSLVGTIGAPAIDFYFGTANSTGKTPILVTFDGAQISSGATVAEGTYTSSGRFKLIFNPNYAGESFVALSGRMAHEAMHDDSASNHVDSQDEEVILNFVESTVYAQQIVTDFTYATSKNQYTLYANYRLMLAINSGDRQFPRVGIGKAPIKGGVANPGFAFNTPYVGTNADSFDDDVRTEFAARNIADKPPTDSTDTSRQILKNLTGNTYTATTGKFGDDLIADIDIAQDTLGDQFVAQRVARVLQLKV